MPLVRVRTLKTVAFLLSLVAAVAPLGAQETKPEREILGRALYDFGGVSGGWLLNERCRLLSRAERREFEWTYAQLNILFQSKLGPGVIRHIQKIATDVAVQEKHADCKDSTKKLVTDGLRKAREMDHLLSNAPYDPETSYKSYIANQFYRIDIGMKINSTCNHIPMELKAKIDDAYDEVMQFTLAVVGAKVINGIFGQSLTVSSQPRFTTCGPQTDQIVKLSSTQLRESLSAIRHDISLPN